MRKRSVPLACLLTLAIASCFTPVAPGQTTQSAATATAPALKAQDTRGTPAERADAILRQLTLDEKISLLSGNQFITRAIPRLGIPGFTMSDGPQGVRNGPNNQNRACAFPAGVALAATFDTALAAAYGRAVALEARARGTHFQLGPGVNIARVPVNGRNFEYYGEDPYLAGMIAAEWCNACTAQGVVPTIKHFAANNQETNRMTVDVQVDERVLHEIYFPAFKRAIERVQRTGGVLAVMCSYNRLNGHYASNNHWLQNEVLKGQWGFTGLNMSDWGASHDVTDVARGLDLEMPTGANLNPAKIKAALEAGTVKQSDIDHAVRRLLFTAFAAGWLNDGWQQKNASLPADSPDSHKVALDVANASIVLLKNANDTLPLDRSRVKTIVVLGPNATAPAGPNGQPGLPFNIGGGGSGFVTPFENRNEEADYLKGITRSAGDNIQVTYLPMPPETFPGDAFNALTFARTAPDGEPGLTLAVEPVGDGEMFAIAPTVQKEINLSWEPGKLPHGVPARRDATFTWTGILVPPRDADVQVRTLGNASVSIGDQGFGNGAIVHLKKDMPTPIRISARAQHTPPAARGRNRGAPPAPVNGSIRVALAPPAIPDLAPAQTADAVIVCVGLNRNTETEDRDRPFELPALQQYLINRAAAANPRTVVINNSGAAVGMNAWHDNVPAILQAWYLGQAGGTAIANVLFGDVNPSGKLPSTFDKSFEDNPAAPFYPGKTVQGVPYPVEPYAEGLFYGYRGYDKAKKDPLYPFGHGLSYTTFQLSNLKSAMTADLGYRFTLTITNTGPRAGSQVLQLYLGEQSPPLPRPQRELKAFTKIHLAPGESQEAALYLEPEALRYWNPDTKSWTHTPNARYTAEIGFSARDLPLRQEIR